MKVVEKKLVVGACILHERTDEGQVSTKWCYLRGVTLNCQCVYSYCTCARDWWTVIVSKEISQSLRGKPSRSMVIQHVGSLNIHLLSNRVTNPLIACVCEALYLPISNKCPFVCPGVDFSVTTLNTLSFLFSSNLPNTTPCFRGRIASRRGCGCILPRSTTDTGKH